MPTLISGLSGRPTAVSAGHESGPTRTEYSHFFDSNPRGLSAGVALISDYRQRCGILVLRSLADFCRVTGLIWSAASPPFLPLTSLATAASWVQTNLVLSLP